MDIITENDVCMYDAEDGLLKLLDINNFSFDNNEKINIEIEQGESIKNSIVYLRIHDTRFNDICRCFKNNPVSIKIRNGNKVFNYIPESGFVS